MTTPVADSTSSAGDGGATADPLERQFRRHAGQVSRQAAVFFAGTVFLAVGGYLFKVYVSRTLGAAGVGIYSLGMTLVAFGAVVAGLGLPPTAARFVAIYEGGGATAEIRRFATVGLRWLLLAAAAAGTGMIVFREAIAGHIFAEPELARWLPLFAVILFLHTCRVFFGQFLRGLREVARRTVVNHFIAFPIKALTTATLFTLGWGLGGYVTAEAVSCGVAVALLGTVAWRRIPSTSTPGEGAPAHPRREGTEARYAASMIGLGLLGFVAGQADVFLLGVFLDASRVGIYAVAVTTASMVPTLLRSVGSIFGPIIADLHARRQTELLERLFHTSTKWCLGLTWPLVVVIALFSRELMRLFGDEFEAGAATLALLAAAQLINVGVGTAGNMLVMSGNQRSEIVVVALAAALALTLDVALIPRWGLLGAAAALAASLIGSNLLRAWMVWRRLGLLPYGRGAPRLLWALAASAATAGAVWWWHPVGDIPAILLALVGSYGAFAVAAAVSALDRDDLIIARAVREKLKF